jgi:hypothetical protein
MENAQTNLSGYKRGELDPIVNIIPEKPKHTLPAASNSFLTNPDQIAIKKMESFT